MFWCGKTSRDFIVKKDSLISFDITNTPTLFVAGSFGVTNKEYRWLNDEVFELNTKF